MNLLLDTHVFLWWDDQDTRLNAEACSALADPANQIFVSAVSIWEIAIKRRLKKLSFGGSPVAAVAANGLHELPVLPIDAEHAGDLAWQHNDPFDRMLVAQARRLGIILVTADTTIRAYPHVAQLWAG